LDYVFCLVVGGVYLYAINRTIISATFIRISQLELYAVGLVCILVFFGVLFNKWTRLVAAGLVLISALHVFLTLEYFSEQYPRLYETFLMVTGRLPYTPELGRFVVWGIGLLLAFVVVIFMVHQFNFYFLALGGAAAFVLTWVPGFSRDEGAFLFFLAAFCLILMRKNNKSVAAALAAVPLCVAVVWLANVQMPDESELFVRRYISPQEGRMNSVGDFFYELFNQPHFSFQTTGFAGAGGRLGGAVTPNNRFVMTVLAPGRTYLAGAVSNTYTGDRWVQTLGEWDIFTHGLPPSHFEKLETTAALIRGATHIDTRASIAVEQMGFTGAETRRLHAREFPVIGVVEMPRMRDALLVSLTSAENDLLVPAGGLRRGFPILDFETFEYRIPSERRVYWHTYMPLDIITIVQGPNRTGTIFQPPRTTALWFHEESFDYAPYVQILPTGDRQTPGFMRRGAGYHMQFLNVNTQLSFIENILANTNAGVYESRAEYTNTEMQLFGGESPPFAEPRHLGREGGSRGDGNRLYADLPQMPLTVSRFAEMVQLYTHPDGVLRYITDPELFMQLLDSFSTEVLTGYARQVRRHFLEVPEIVPQRVHDLTREIIAGQTNDFGRVMAVRDFLLQFPYTLEPVPVPRGVCFVDHFLFEGQEGYCTYFASAMAVMARIAGVPSRYVEGFVLPPTAHPEEPVTVTNRMAHAWVEVYLEGFGWKIVEATPTYAFLMNPEIPLPPEGAIADAWSDPSWIAGMQDMMSDWEMEEADMQAFWGNHPLLIAAPETDDPPHYALWVTVGFAAFAALGLAAFFALRNYQIKSNERRANKLSSNEQVKTYFRAILNIVTYYTNPLTAEETPKSYGTRMGKRFAFRSDTIFFRDLITLYYKAKYAPKEITEAEAGIMKEAHRDMLELLRQMRHKWVFIYLRYVLRVGEI
jgi:hypothetical protein